MERLRTDVANFFVCRFMNLKISIITATFNSDSTVRDTFESILRQSYQNYEVVVKDGGSKDNTLDIIREYEPRFEGKMRWVSSPDKGLYDAMNQGIAMASGDVVGILNSDDFYTSDTILECIASAFGKKDIDAVYGDIHFVDCSNLKKCVRYYSSKPFRRGWMRLGFMPAHPSFYCKKEVYDKYGAFDTSFKIGADFESLLRFIFVNRIKTTYLPLDFVTMRTGGISTSGVSSHKQIMKDHLKAFKKNGVYTNAFILSLRYFYKIYEVLKSKVVYR